MTAEFVVIVQQQDAGIRVRGAKVMRGSQAADAGTNHHEIEMLLRRQAFELIALAVAHPMSGFQVRWRAAAPAGSGRRVGWARLLRAQCPGQQASGHSHGKAVDKFTPCNAIAHALSAQEF